MTKQKDERSLVWELIRGSNTDVFVWTEVKYKLRFHLYHKKRTTPEDSRIYRKANDVSLVGQASGFGRQNQI